MAVIARQPGADPDPASITMALTDRLARFKQPKHVVVVDELPRNTMGKVQKAALRAEYQHLFTGA